MGDLDTILKRAVVFFVEETEIVLCNRCKGTGYEERIALEESYRDDDVVRRSLCDSCCGDGRIVKKESYLKTTSTSTTEYIPFTEFEGDPYETKKEQISITQDKRDTRLEKKHPKLAEHTYAVYNKLVEDYRLLELINKENNER